MALCETCTYWAREFASLDEHHPACPHHPSNAASPTAMPGPVSDAYDPEFGTAANADMIRDALGAVYRVVSATLGDQPPVFILDLIRRPDGPAVTATLTEKQWRLIRFALERAGESV